MEENRVQSVVVSRLKFPDYITNRAIGSKNYLGVDDDIHLKLYSSYDYFVNRSRRRLCNESVRDSGGIFNLEFSLDGRILVAACEKKRVLLFDPISQKLSNTIEEAHSSCVNCVRFLDDKTFATCSDDTSIKLWDIRKLKQSVKTLHGHSNWVKNIEYSEKEQLMITSAFDGSVHAWNLKSTTESGMLYDKVFLMTGLMRTKLTPDGTKMIISSTSGYMIIIHDLNLSTLATDLESFKPNLYRLMQISEQNYPMGTATNYLFHPSRKRNRIEFIDDFPNDAEVISSLQIHPHGWCAVTRNLSGEDEDQEWTCVHDIQERDESQYEEAYTYIEEEFDSDSDENNMNTRPTDLWLGFINFEQYQRRQSMTRNRRGDLSENFSVTSMSLYNSGMLGHRRHSPPSASDVLNQRNKVLKNLPRLTHFIMEKNVGKGYIKELCFSSDGRVICSPYGKGVRLLSFNDKVQELSYCVPEQPQKLFTLLELNNYHRGDVVSCKFSPIFSQLVSGCLGGEVKWYQPQF